MGGRGISIGENGIFKGLEGFRGEGYLTQWEERVSQYEKMVSLSIISRGEFGISCSWQFPNANSFASPPRATSKNHAVVTWHFFFNITKFSRNFEQI